MRERQGHIGAERPATGEPPRADRDLAAVQRRQRGGSHSHSTRQQTQARGAGRREERRRLTGGGCRRSPGVQRFAPGEEAGGG